MRRRRLRPDEIELWEKVAAATRRLHPAARPIPPALPEAPALGADSVVPDAPQPRAARHFAGEWAHLTPAALQTDKGAGRGGGSGGSRRAPAGTSVDLQPAPGDLLAARNGGLDRGRSEDLRRGKLAPEARLDLHGMTQAEAHSALVGFVLASHGAGRRLVLVVTGKGQRRHAGAEGWPEQRGDGARGILSHSVPRWLALPPFDRLVLHLSHAHASHGGSGALYVYLRRKGRG